MQGGDGTIGEGDPLPFHRDLVVAGLEVDDRLVEIIDAVGVAEGAPADDFAELASHSQRRFEIHIGNPHGNAVGGNGAKAALDHFHIPLAAFVADAICQLVETGGLQVGRGGWEAQGLPIFTGEHRDYPSRFEPERQ